MKGEKEECQKPNGAHNKCRQREIATLLFGVFFFLCKIFFFCRKFPFNPHTAECMCCTFLFYQKKKKEKKEVKEVGEMIWQNLISMFC